MEKRHTKTVDDQSVNRAQVKKKKKNFPPHVLITIFWGPRVLKEEDKGAKLNSHAKDSLKVTHSNFFNVHQKKQQQQLDQLGETFSFFFSFLRDLCEEEALEIHMTSTEFNPCALQF